MYSLEVLGAIRVYSNFAHNLTWNCHLALPTLPVMSYNSNLRASTTSDSPEDEQKNIGSDRGHLKHPFPSSSITLESISESDNPNEDSNKSVIQERAPLAEDLQDATSSNRVNLVESSSSNSSPNSSLHSPMHRSPSPMDKSSDTSNAQWRADLERLSASYPNAAYDFFGTPGSPLCVYKTGDPWPVRTGLEAQRIIREIHPVQHDHPIQAIWPDIGKKLYTLLDERKVRWTSIDPVAFAEAGKEPFCPLLLWIGVEPGSLSYEDARTAAEAATSLLTDSGLEGFEIGFRESIVIRSSSRPKMMSYHTPDPPDLSNPSGTSDKDSMLEFRKPFTPILGLPISCNGEGTGALYLRESKDSDRVYLLTCSHVVRHETDDSSPHRKCFHEKVHAPGQKAYNDVIKRLKATIDTTPNDADAERIAHNSEKAAEFERKMCLAQDLHTKLKQHCRSSEARVIGEVTYASLLNADNPFRFNEDWALIEINNDKLDWTSFNGNQVYVDKEPGDYIRTMYPYRNDRKNTVYPENRFLPVSNVVSTDHPPNLQHLDKNGKKCLFVVKMAVHPVQPLALAQV
ncbi:hypothetical protein EV361DRAFT_574896 [Lentinula raphanica]|nr:hypothetical protein EV361DRAFT_574896 [Lentinula raphanica]